MSMDRSRAVSRISGISKSFTEHIVKAVVYKNTTDNLKHWVDEISEYLSIVNDITVKPKDKKLKVADISRSLFGEFGDARNDANIILRSFALEVRHSKEYPDFIVTDDLTNALYFAFQLIYSETLPILTVKNSYTKDDFIPIVCRALKISAKDLSD